MWEQVAGLVGKPAHLRRHLAAGKSPAGQTHMEGCMLSCGVEIVCLHECVCLNVLVLEPVTQDSIINEHDLLGHLDQAWSRWVIWRLVKSSLLAQLC